MLVRLPCSLSPISIHPMLETNLKYVHVVQLNHKTKEQFRLYSNGNGGKTKVSILINNITGCGAALLCHGSGLCPPCVCLSKHNGHFTQHQVEATEVEAQPVLV